MKNSHPIMKNKTIPTTISGNAALIERFLVPFLRKVINAEVPIIAKGLNFASQDTIIAVKPSPPTVDSAETVWSRAEILIM